MDWKGLVGAVAPTLGTALGGPFGGMAATWLAKQLGVEEAQLEKAIESASPDTMLRIRQLDNDFKVEMRKLGLQETQLAADDRKNARNMAVSTTLVPQMVISAIFIVAFTLILHTVFVETLDLDDMQKSIIMYLLGILSAGIVQVMNFWFGSSSGSKEKTAQLKL